MTVTILATLFILLLLLLTVIGFKTAITRGKTPGELNKERCSLCRQKYNKSQMIERQVGDSRLFYFCQSCITSLHNELLSKN